jgi:hypothetical protein
LIVRVFEAIEGGEAGSPALNVMRNGNPTHTGMRRSVMKIRPSYVWIWSATLGALVGCSDSPPRDQGSVAAYEASIPDTIRQELVRLGVEDQEIRQGLSPERMRDTAFARSMLRGDSVRTSRLKVIVEQYGWPDSSRVGREAAQAAFLILQHSPERQFQKEMLPVIEEQARQGAVPPSEAALLIDRVLMHDGLPQRYGTQFKMAEGRWVLHPVEDEDALEARRRSMGLPPMDEYMRMMEEAYGAPVVRQP